MKRTQAATNREIPVSKTIPYSSHVTPHVVTTLGADLVTCFRVTGIAHESADDADIESWHNRLNGLFKTIQSPRLWIYTHTIRQERREYPAGDFEPGSFAHQLNEDYRRRVMDPKEPMMCNDLYVTLVYAQEDNKAQKFLSRFGKASGEDIWAKQENALEELEDIVRSIEAGLRDYRPSRLGCYEHNGETFSEILELFGFLLNGEWQRWPVPRLRPGEDCSIADLLATARPFFGSETFELRGATDSKVGAILALKEYPTRTASGFMNVLLSLPFEFVLTQSFHFIPRQAALRLLTVQQSKMMNSGDKARSQIEQLEIALDELASGEFCMGEHHLSLTVKADNVKVLRDRVALARDNLSDCGAVAVREDWGLEAAFWSQLPGNSRYRTRPSPITSRNFAGFASMHNYPSGLARGNQWGPAVALLKTASGTPYYFNFHIPPKGRRRGRSALEELKENPDDRVPGNTLIIGPTGSGKTVVQTFLLAQLEKFQPTIFYYDKDRGMDIFIRAVGGNYMAIENGVPTGFNPFQMEPTPANISFLQAWVRKLVTTGDYHLSTAEEREIDAGIAGVLDLPFVERRLSRLIDFLDVSHQEGAASRLAIWTSGSLAWVFDNDVDVIDPNTHRVNGFDVTDLLDNDQVREPVLMYLLHRQEEVIDGRRFILGFDEGWKSLYDPAVAAYLENKELTIRKQNGLVIFGTQNPSHVIKSPIADTLIQQSPTQIYLPNPKAQRKDYIEGFKLSEREYELIQDVMPNMPGHYFLCKQGTQAAICELNLGGLDEALAVLSGTTASVELLQSILPETGPDPADWLPVFHERRKK